jgi:hypothetical protein
MPAGLCEPRCRRGYLCVNGACVSVCNPPCAAGETCLENGSCEAPPPGPAPITPAPVYSPPVYAPAPVQSPPLAPPPMTRREYERQREAEEPDPPSNIAIHANFLDALQWGITGALDVEIWQKLGVFLELRAPNAGLLSYFDFWPLGPGRHTGYRNNYSTHFDNGYGGALGAEKFFGDKPGLRGLYVAAGVEVLNHRMEIDSGTAWTAGAIEEWFVVPHARGGIRYRGLSFLFALGLRAGAGFLVSSTFHTLAETTTWGESRRIYFDGAVIMDMGFFLR